ncbi:uncharacterized protein LOC128386146 isoform X2 [Panonychus citri]|uniref:uncharacterized protein LOC128386146 isoform X2 n=1 Tax=Panonychus citri TaxID=50023 RepID=UPI002307A68B|nr:uncharacterized protein LOC128386146 isoform X2 [Panonychus citri]
MGDDEGGHHSQGSSIKPTIERGASWSYSETRILLSLWGQDLVQRQLTNSKRTRHVWEKIAERIKEHGYERTADQVRTRVFNMIAEYRRILKNPTAERKKKCIFFDALHKIYQAKDANGVKAALNYDDDYDLEPLDLGPDDGMDGDDRVDSGEEGDDLFSYTMSPNSNGVSERQGTSTNYREPSASTSTHNLDKSRNLDHDSGNPAKRLRSDSNPSAFYQHSSNGNQANANYEAPPTASALLIDRIFKHLTKETEVMREWISLEKERFEREASRRKEENEREERREKAFLDTLMKMQEHTFKLLSCFNADKSPTPKSNSASETSTTYMNETTPPPTSTTTPIPQRSYSGTRSTTKQQQQQQHMLC